jgi:hypothetical protein
MVDSAKEAVLDLWVEDFSVLKEMINKRLSSSLTKIQMEVIYPFVCQVCHSM